MESLTISMDLPVSLPPVPLPGSGPVLVSGHPACLTVGLLLALRAATPARPLLAVDGANAIDPYLLADLSRRAGGGPRELLASVLISRVFTAYQLEAAVADRLEGAIAVYRPCGVLLAGLLDPLYDEEFSSAEARRIFHRILEVVVSLADRPLLVVAACPDGPSARGRGQFQDRLADASSCRLTVEAPDRGIAITASKPLQGRWLWDPAIALLAARRWR